MENKMQKVETVKTIQNKTKQKKIIPLISEENAMVVKNTIYDI